MAFMFSRSAPDRFPQNQIAPKSKRPNLVRDWASINQRRGALAARSNVRGLQALRTLDGVELHFLPFRQGAEAIRLDCGVMTENILTPVVLGNETKALRLIEPLHSTSCHLSLFFFRFEPQKRGSSPASVWQVIAF
jgi:hypothetical protein